jgi:hypothetical protein
MPVPENHFLRQFDRYPEGEPRLAAMARHCAILYNSLEREKARRISELQGVVEALKAANPHTKLAVELTLYIEEDPER